MKFPVNKPGVSTLGLTGLVLLTGIIWEQISPWWLVLSVFLILSGIGHEHKAND